MKRLGSQTVKFQAPPLISAHAAVGSVMEGQGPLCAYFDFISNDPYFGAKSWERAESEMLKKCFELCMEKAAISPLQPDYIISGDLLNQCVGSAFAIKDSGVPYFGLYGACSTMAESLSLAAMLLDGGYAERVCALTSSHYCSAERQFRLPLAYGGLCSPTSQRTATAAGCLLVEAQGNGTAEITHVTTGKIIDGGISDASNLGAAMAPAALETLCTHFSDTGRSPEYYDLIVTGDLGAVGHSILLELAEQQGFALSQNCKDCGMLLYDPQKQPVHAGGSGCGCSAGVLAGYLLSEMSSGRLERLLFAATGALMSPTTALQGESILGICHAVAIERKG